jgi:ketosteroid isomerase-like protein
MDGRTESEVITVLERMCSGFAERDADAVMGLFGADPDPNLVVVTSEQWLLRGPHELRAFLDRYVQGDTTYSWEWDRHDVSGVGEVAWLLAEGTESAATGDRVEQHPYRMTLVLARPDDGWVLRQVHGSSPH